MPSTKAKVGYAAAGVAAVVAAIAVSRSETEPRPRVDVVASCAQVVPGLGGFGLNAAFYTGDVAGWPWQWGFLAFDAVTGAPNLRNGVGKNGLGYCQPAVAIEGDCWQSVTTLAATPNTKKWIVAAGGPYMCGGEGLQVWKWNGSTFSWWALIKSPDHPLNETGTDLRLVGDEAWGKTVMGGVGFNRYDLNQKALLSTMNTTAPGFIPQRDVQGYTYRLFPVIPTPLPIPWGGAKAFYALRQGGPAPTVPPVPTPAPIPTPGAHPQADYIEALAKAGISAGCGPGAFCPDAPLTRGQAAVWFWKERHGALLPPKCTGMFPVDVPCGGAP